jgi:hypothetical protein
LLKFLSIAYFIHQCITSKFLFQKQSICFPGIERQADAWPLREIVECLYWDLDKRLIVVPHYGLVAYNAATIDIRLGNPSIQLRTN